MAPGVATPEQRHRDEFLSSVEDRLDDPEIQPADACRATLALLQDEVRLGEIEDVQHAMPAALRELWPERVA